jgi:hypothetical protein
MIITIIFTVILIYLFCGLVFSLAFVTRGAAKIDEGAKDSTPGFKIIIIPGTMVFWPFLLNKWLGTKKNMHHD